MRRWIGKAVTVTAAAAVVVALWAAPWRTAVTAEPAPEDGMRFVDAAAQAREFVGYYHSIPLTREQEKIKEAALATLKAPCCSKFSLATCCCPCNLAKSAWGLAHLLIARRHYTAEQVNAAVAEWVRFVNKDGFSGDACFVGGCTRPFHQNGCGGMNENKIDT